MTIAERYAKYTTEELKEGIASLKEQIAENNRCKAANEAAGNAEFFRTAYERGERLHSLLLDVECALLGRTDK